MAFQLHCNNPELVQMDKCIHMHTRFRYTHTYTHTHTHTLTHTHTDSQMHAVCGVPFINKTDGDEWSKLVGCGSFESRTLPSLFPVVCLMGYGQIGKKSG